MKKVKGSLIQKNIQEFFTPKEHVYTCKRCGIRIVGACDFHHHKSTCKHCKVCKKTFFHEENFVKHYRNCPPKRFPCKQCKKTFSRPSDMKKHEKIHSSQDRHFTCHWCGCACLTGKQLNIHIEQNHSQG